MRPKITHQIKFGYIIRIRKKIIKKAKWLIVYGNFILLLTNGVIASQAIGLTIFLTFAPRMRFTQSLSEKVKMALIIDNIANKLIYKEPEMMNRSNRFLINLNMWGCITYNTWVRASGIYFQPVLHYPPHIGEWGNVNNRDPLYVGG